jgi:hypothetical protein
MVGSMLCKLNILALAGGKDQGRIDLFAQTSRLPVKTTFSDSSALAEKRCGKSGQAVLRHDPQTARIADDYPILSGASERRSLSDCCPLGGGR